MRVAIADDEADITAHISSALEATGIACDTFVDGAQLTNALKRGTYDVVLVDWMMPPPTGVEVVAWAMDHFDTPPAFILMTSRNSAEDIVRGLESGASDYIIKPENPKIIIARIRAAARQGASPAKDRSETFGPYTFDHLAQTITVNGDAVKLTAKEFDLARLFFQNRDRPLSRSYLLGEVWGSSEGVETRTLDMHVSRLRSKLSLRPENGFVIQSVFGFGYRLDGFESGEKA